MCTCLFPQGPSGERGDRGEPGDEGYPVEIYTIKLLLIWSHIAKSAGHFYP